MQSWRVQLFNENHTRRNQYQNKWGWRTDTWVGRQIDGNHCQWTEKKERMKRNKGHLQYVWDSKFTNIYIIEIVKGEEREKGPEKIFEDNNSEFP